MVLTIDIGTTTCKGAVFSPNGRMLESARLFVAMRSDENGAQEADPSNWARCLTMLCRRLCPGKPIRAITISGNGPTVVPVYSSPFLSEDMVVADAGMARLWLDRRAVSEAEQIANIAGFFMDSSFFLPKVLHIYHTDRPSYEKTAWFLSSSEYMNYLLTGEAKAILHAPDAVRWYWSEQLVETLGLDKTKFPPFCMPGDLVGNVSRLASQATGLKEGLPVYAGGPDFLVSILGSGAVKPGRVCDRSGTSEGINLCTHTPIYDDRLMTYLHPVQPYYNVSGIISTSGKAIEWIKEVLGMTALPFPQVYEQMARAKAGAGGLIFLPYLCGERAPIWDPYAKGVFCGLTLSTNSNEMLRSVAEGVCFAIRDVIEVMEELKGNVEQLRATGGPSESWFLNQLKADITGRPVGIPCCSEAELAGSMVIAKTSLGDYSSLEEAAEQLICIAQWYDPATSHASLYTKLFTEYRETYANLKDGWRKQR